MMVFCALPVASFAHHSRVMFDESKSVVYRGMVKEFQFTNPHAWLIVDVEGANGQVTTWGFETLAPSSLMRLGIRKGDFPFGTKVTVKGNPMKDGRPAAYLISVTRADGKVFSVQPESPAVPSASPSPSDRGAKPQAPASPR